MRYKPLALAAAALLAGYLGLGGGARAAYVMTGAAMPDSATSQDGNIQLASHWHHHHHHHGFGSSIFLGFGFPGFYEPYYYEPYYYEPYYYEPYYYGHFYYHHKRHCRHPDKVHHRCRSPYRY